MSTEPFPGLRPFHRDEADIFFGRESVIDEMVSRLAAHRFLAVTGTSGSGKSSLVFTGLLDALELGLLARAGSDWTIAQCRPGNRPLRALAESLLKSTETARFEHDSLLLEAALSRGPAGLLQWLAEAHLPPRNNLLLLVDQFEELFRYRGVEIADTSSTDVDETRQRQVWEEAASAFVDVLVGAAAAPDRRIYVVLTMRSEYLGECAQFAGLAEAINRGQFLTPRLNREQLSEAVTGPVQVYGGAIEPALVNRVLNEMGNDPDQLPLMQHAMMRMWRRAKAEHKGAVRLTEADYETWIGGLKLALSAHATEVLDSLSAEDQALAQTLFRCLTEGSTVGDARRHPITLQEAADVAEVEPERLKPIVETFRAPGCDFLTPATGPLESDTTIDIAHESLIRQWDKLREWMGEEFSSAALWRRLSSAAADWENKKVAPWVSPDLENALAWRERQMPTEAWARRYGGNLQQAFRFLDASRAEARSRRFGKLVPWFLAAAGVFFAVAVVAGVMAVRASNAEYKANVDRKKLQQNEQVLAALSAQQRIHGRVRAAQAEDLDLARQFALQAINMLPGDPTTPAYPQLMRVLRDAYAIDYGARLLVGSEDTKFLIVDSHGTRAAAVTANGAVALWSLATGLPGPHLSSDSLSSTALAFSPDGAFLATAEDTISIWDASSGEELAHFSDQTDAEVSDLAVSLDGKRVVSLDKNGNAEVWDARSKTKIATVACPAPAATSGEQSDAGSELGHVALRDDGKAALVSWPDGRVGLWQEGAKPDCQTRGRAASFVLFDKVNPVVIGDMPVSLADSPPAGFSGATILGRLRTPLRFDGWTKFTANAGGHWAFQAISVDGGTALARDVSGSQNAPVYALTPCVDCIYAGVTRGDVRAVAHALNSPLTATASGSTITVAGGDQPSKSYDAPTEVQRVAISPDGAAIAAIGDDAGWVWLKGADAPKPLDGLRVPLSVAFSPDGKSLVTADGSYQNLVKVWDIEADPPTANALTGHTDDVRQALFLSNDRIVSVSDDKTIRFWRFGSGKQQNETQTPAVGEQKTPSPSADRTAPQSKKPVAQMSQWEEEQDLQLKIANEPGRLIAISFDKTNERLAIMSSTGRVYLADLKTKQAPKPIWPSNRAAQAIEFAPDGSKLAIVTRGADDGKGSLLAEGVQIVPLPVPGAVPDPADAKASMDVDPTFPYRGGIAFDGDSHILLATAEGLLRADSNHPPAVNAAPNVTDSELVKLSDLLIANRRSPEELDRIAKGDEADEASDGNAVGLTCADNIDPCLKAVQDHPDDPAGWHKLAAAGQDRGFLQSAAELVGAIEGDASLAEQYAKRLSGTKSLGPALSHWFLLGMFRPDRPVSAALVTDLLASGLLTPAQRSDLRTMFEARAGQQDAGADAALAILSMQGSPTKDETKQALKNLLIAERLAPDQRPDLIQAVLRANLVRAVAPEDVLELQNATEHLGPSRPAPGQGAPAWKPNLTDVNLRSELGQLKLFELAFQRLQEKWPAEPKLDLLEGLVRVELSADILRARTSDDQALTAARDTLAKAVRQLAPSHESLSQAKTDADTLLDASLSEPLKWEELLKLARDFEATEPELAVRAFAYVLRSTGEAANDERKISSDLASAFQEAQHKLLGFIGSGIGREAIVDELAPETWRWWIVGRKILNVDLKPKEAEDYFKETVDLLRFLSEARPESVDLLKYLTDAVGWHAVAAIRSGSYAQLPFADRLAPLLAAERLNKRNSQLGEDRMGEAAEIFFKQIWSADADRTPLYGTLAPGLTVADLSDVMALVAKNSPPLLAPDSVDYDSVIRNFVYLLGTVRLAADPHAAPVQDCDRLAASPIDPWRVAPGVTLTNTTADAAIAACVAALDKSDQPRFDLQLGLAYEQKANSDSANIVEWRSKARDAFVKAFTQGYFPTLDQIAIETYADDSKDYKEAYLALYAHYIFATARPIVDAMVADGSARDHAAGVRFLLEQAISYGDVDSELTLAELIANGMLQNDDPLEGATRVLIAQRLGSADTRKRAEAVWSKIRQSLSDGQQQQAEFDANHIEIGGFPPPPDGMLKAFQSLRLDEPPKSN